MTAELKLLDLFSCAGGAGRGYKNVGFHVTGVDIVRPSRYGGDRFKRADALRFLEKWGHKYDVIHASPPCQKWTRAAVIYGNEHKDYISQVREMLEDLGKPYIIENVLEAPLIDAIKLCGCMFPQLRVYRPRGFETNFHLRHRECRPHKASVAKMGRPPKDFEFMHVVGNFSDIEAASKAMDIDWMYRKELREAIPPAYTEWIGKRLIAQLV